MRRLPVPNNWMANRKNHIHLLLGILGGLALGYRQLTALAAPPAQQPDFAAIDAYVEAEIKADRVPGLALAIVRGEEILHLRGFGIAGPPNRPVTPQTPFLLGSMSKAFTGLAIMQLVEAGQLDLDSPVQQYIPWFRVASPDTSARILVRHLLYHTSGLPPAAARARGDDVSLEADVRELSNVMLTHPPGAEYLYSSANYQVLGLLIEVVTGQPYATHIQQQIFTPLEMSHSFTSQADAMRAGMASGYQLWFGIPVATDLPYEVERLPSASLISSAEDLTHFLIAHLNEGRYKGNMILSPTGMAEVHRPAAEGEGFGYAMGWRVGPIHGTPAIHHGGILPNFRGKMIMFPEQKWGVVVLTNVSSFVGSPTSHRMADEVAGMLVGQTPTRPTLSLGTLYLLITIGMLVITLDEVRKIIGFRRWRAELNQPTSDPARRFRQVMLSQGIDIAIPVALLIGLPRLLGIPLAEMVRQGPDISYWLITNSILTLGLALVKAGLALTTFRRARLAPVEPGG